MSNDFQITSAVQVLEDLLCESLFSQENFKISKLVSVHEHQSVAFA